jgi:ABC-type transporter Mla subunit MlaD
LSAGASSADDDLPTSDDVVAEFRRALHDPEHRPTRLVVARLVDLLRSNLAQWNLEDVARGAGADDGAVAGTKRAIDKLNAGRHRIVEEIDTAIDRAVTQSAAAPLATESPAMAFDRLSVLVIRIHHTEGDADRYAARLPVLYRQLAELQQAIDALIDDVRDGTRRFVRYQSLKLYGE